LRFSSCVKSIDYNGTYDVFVITVQKIGSKDTYTILAKHIVIGIGSIPFIPNNIHQDDYDNIIHSSAYTYFKNKIVKSKEICLVGSGQSAAEIFLDLLNAVDLSATKVNWMTKADRFYAMENTKLNYEMTSPEYIDFFYRLDPETKEHLLHQQSSLYKGINNELINAIYDKLYDLLIEGKSYEISIHTHSELRRLFKKTTTACELLFYHNAIKKDFNISSDYVILATGHRYITPHFLKPLKKFIRLDKNDRYVLSRHYSIDAHNRIFVQNAEIHSHGFNAPDLGLGAYRNAVIINTILKADIYPIDNKTSFQSFGIAK
jgi:lysine N6-hydroxylase